MNESLFGLSSKDYSFPSNPVSFKKGFRQEKNGKHSKQKCRNRFLKRK